MYTLLLDSSYTFLHVGIAKNNELLKSTSYEAWQRQSEFMIVEIDKLLNELDIKKEDLSDIVVSIGPGSFTGIRIALTIAKVISLALNIDVYSVSSLYIKKIKDTPTICLINARGNRSYIGCYDNEEVLLEDQILTNDEVKKYIEDHPTYFVSGDVNYLGLRGNEISPFENMISYKLSHKLAHDALSIKPSYLKESY